MASAPIWSSRAKYLALNSYSSSTFIRPQGAKNRAPHSTSTLIAKHGVPAAMPATTRASGAPPRNIWYRPVYSRGQPSPGAEAGPSPIRPSSSSDIQFLHVLAPQRLLHLGHDLGLREVPPHVRDVRVNHQQLVAVDGQLLLGREVDGPFGARTRRHGDEDSPHERLLAPPAPIVVIDLHLYAFHAAIVHPAAQQVGHHRRNALSAR